MRSDARDAALLADSAASGRVSETYTKVHAEELAEDVASLADELEKSDASANVKDDVRRLAQTARDAARFTKDVADDRGEPSQLYKLATQLQQLGGDADSLTR